MEISKKGWGGQSHYILFFSKKKGCLDHVFCTLVGGLFFSFIFHSLGGGVSENIEIPILILTLPFLTASLNVSMELHCAVYTEYRVSK